MSDRALWERHYVKTRNGRRAVYRRARDGGAPSRNAEHGGAPSLTAGVDPVLGGTDWGEARAEVPLARRVVNSSGDLKRTRAARYSTWFRAQGTMGELAQDESYVRMQRMLDEDYDEDDGHALAAFYSNMSGLLGRVKWPGVKPLEDILEDLNDKLQFRGEETRGFDFRDIYSRWEYRYQVIETIGREGNEGVSQVVVEHRAAYPKRKGWAKR